MNIIGNPITLGEKATVVAVLIGWKSGNTLAEVGNVILESDSRYFKTSGSTQYEGFICQRAGTYQVDYGVKGCYNSSGNRIDATVYVYKNGSSVSSKKSSSTSYAQESVQVTLNALDTLELWGKNNSNSNNISPVYMVVTTT